MKLRFFSFIFLVITTSSCTPARHRFVRRDLYKINLGTSVHREHKTIVETDNILPLLKKLTLVLEKFGYKLERDHNWSFQLLPYKGTAYSSSYRSKSNQLYCYVNVDSKDVEITFKVYGSPDLFAPTTTDKVEFPPTDELHEKIEPVIKEISFFLRKHFADYGMQVSKIYWDDSSLPQ